MSDSDRVIIENVTDEQIKQLRMEAVEAGDFGMACICHVALGGELEENYNLIVGWRKWTVEDARAECAGVIAGNLSKSWEV